MLALSMVDRAIPREFGEAARPSQLDDGKDQFARDFAIIIVNQEIVIRLRDNLLSVLFLHVPCERPDSWLWNRHSHVRFPINAGTKRIESKLMQAAIAVGRLQPPVHP